MTKKPRRPAVVNIKMAGTGDTRAVLIDNLLDEWPFICIRGVQNQWAAWHKPGVRHVWLKTTAMADSHSAR